MQPARSQADTGIVNRLSPVRKLRLAAEILTTYLHVWWIVRRQALPRVVAVLRRAPARRPADLPLPDGERDGARLGRAVIRTLSLLPTDSRCLMRSLVLLHLLARRHTDGELVIAVLPGGDVELSAHAWIELGGRPLLPPAEADWGRLVTL